LVKINARDAAEFEQRTAKIFEYCAGMPGLDKRDDESRLSRLPGAYRGESKQALIRWEVGAASWEEWLATTTEEWPLLGDDTSQITVANMPPEPPVLVDGFLHQGSFVASITGAMKTNKSWTLLDLAIAIALGQKWLDKQCAQGHVLYLDAEINRPFWYKRVKLICDAIGADFNALMASRAITPVFLQNHKMSVVEVRSELERMASRGKLQEYSVIIIDPIYQFYADDWEENRNEHIAELGQYLQDVACFLETPVVFAHHDSKGNKEGVRGIERSSGAGAWGRFVAANLSIAYRGSGDGGDDQKYELCWTTTNFPKQSVQVAKRNQFIWEILDEEPDIDTMERQMREVIKVFPQDEGYIRGAVWWQAIVSAGIPISQRHFENRVRRWAHERGYVEKRGEGRKSEWILTYKGFDIKYAKNPDASKEESE
jgi:RecA-family ATPase